VSSGLIEPTLFIPVLDKIQFAEDFAAGRGNHRSVRLPLAGPLGVVAPPESPGPYGLHGAVDFGDVAPGRRDRFWVVQGCFRRFSQHVGSADPKGQLAS